MNETISHRFNASTFGRFINAPLGRIFRLLAGAGFVVAGSSDLPLAARIALLAWSILPLTAGAFDVCWISAALGGPLTGREIRAAR